MFTLFNMDTPSTQQLRVETLVLFSLVLCTVQAHYSTHSEGGKVSWTFPEAHRPRYHDLLAAPGRLLAQNAKRPGLESQAMEDVSKLLQAIEHLHLLASGRRNDPEDEIFDKNVVLDSIMTSLDALTENSDNSSKCVNDTGTLLINIFERQGWALKFLDAAGKPGPGLSEFRFNFVGDYDLCRSLVGEIANDSHTITGNYVTWKVSIGPLNPVNPAASPMIQWGVCMPSTCSEEENTRLVFEVLQNLGLNGTLNALQAESHTDKREASGATVVSIIIIVIIGVLMLVATVYDVLFLQWPRWREERRGEEDINVIMSASRVAGGPSGSSSSYPQSQNDDDEPLILKKDIQAPSPCNTVNIPTGRLAKALVAFSIYTNGSKVLNTTQQPGSISCIHGIRFLSMSWVILGHTFAFSLGVVDNLGTEVQLLLQRWTFDAVANAFVSVDTFFTLSGILVSYLTVTEMRRRGWRLNWGLFYFHRFWRLTPPYMLAIALLLGLQQYFGQGPLWPSVQPGDKAFCEKYWWTNLLYINNLVYKEKVCLGQSWYLANDMQFFVISPLMIIPFYFNAFLGFASCGIFFLTHVITTGVLSAQHKWPTTMVSAAAGTNFYSYFFDYYEAPWCRIGPYIVGVVTGYLLANKKDKIRLTWPTATIGWLVATAVALATVYGLRGEISGKHPISVEVAALYNALSRSAWAASVCWVIVACSTGWGGFVNTLLSWSPFVVLGRMTYMAYLIHLALISIYFQNQQSLFHITTINISMMFMGIMVATYCFSFVLMLALESPMIGLEKVFLPQRRKD